MKKSTIKKLISTDYYEDLVELCKADCNGTLRPYGRNSRFIYEWLPILEEAEKEFK